MIQRRAVKVTNKTGDMVIGFLNRNTYDLDKWVITKEVKFTYPINEASTIEAIGEALEYFVYTGDRIEKVDSEEVLIGSYYVEDLMFEEITIFDI